MNPWLIYAFGQVDNVREVLGMTAMCVGVAGGMIITFSPLEGNGVPRSVRNAIVAAVLAGLVALALPSSRTIALMYVLPRVADSEAIQRDVPELYRLAVDALKSELSDGINNGGMR